MVKIGLIHGMSYRDSRIFVTKEKPEVLVDDMDVAKHYENTGFFKILGEAGTDTAALSAALENEFPADLFTPPEDEESEHVVEAGTDTAEDDVLTKELNSKTVAELKEMCIRDRIMANTITRPWVLSLMCRRIAK